MAEPSLLVCMPQEPTALNTWVHSASFMSIDHHWRQNRFATASDASVLVWDHERSSPINTFKWGIDTISVGRAPLRRQGLTQSDTCFVLV